MDGRPTGRPGPAASIHASAPDAGHAHATHARERPLEPDADARPPAGPPEVSGRRGRPPVVGFPGQGVGRFHGLGADPMLFQYVAGRFELSILPAGTKPNGSSPSSDRDRTQAPAPLSKRCPDIRRSPLRPAMSIRLGSAAVELFPRVSLLAAHVGQRAVERADGQFGTMGWPGGRVSNVDDPLRSELPGASSGPALHSSATAFAQATVFMQPWTWKAPARGRSPLSLSEIVIVSPQSPVWRPCPSGSSRGSMRSDLSAISRNLSE